jgi:hypothetical protein
MVLIGLKKASMPADGEEMVNNSVPIKQGMIENRLELIDAGIGDAFY